MEEKVKEINNEIVRLREQKKEILKEIKLKKIKKTRTAINGKANVLMRISKEFSDKIEYILEKRIEEGLDNNFISRPRIVGLIIKHQNWPVIEKDLIHFNFEGDEDEE